MKKVIIGILAVIGFLSIMAVFAAIGIGLISAMGKERVPRNVILEIDFEAGVVETLPDDAFAQWTMEDVVQLQSLVNALDRAAEDRRVIGLVARIGSGGMGLAHVQEVRDAVMRFQDSGKPAIAYAETFGEFGPGNGGYYLATAFDTILLQPSGDIGITGLIYETPFVRGLLDKLGVEPKMGQRHEYKNAMNFYTETGFTKPHREALEVLMDSQFHQMVEGIAASREFSEEQVYEIFDRGPYLGQEAVDAGLVDGLAYRDEVLKRIRETAGEEGKLLYATQYLKRAGGSGGSGETIALVHAYGQVVRGSSSYSPMSGSVSMGSDSVSSAIRAAVKDRKTRAIILRVDSPGGSYVASDSIWRETRNAQEAGKPVIVSMGNLAASGGYFVAMSADKIVAQPGTITGSIGVLGGKMLTNGFWEKIGVAWDDVHTSANSTMWSSAHDYDQRGRDRFEAGLDRVYRDFTEKVAEGRGLPLEKVREVAKGRIWTGADALGLGLVDELGGVDVAIRLAKESVGLDAEESIRIKRFPRRRSPLEMFFDRSPSSERAALKALGTSLEEIQPAVRMLKKLGLTGEAGVLSVPGDLVEH